MGCSSDNPIFHTWIETPALYKPVIICKYLTWTKKSQKSSTVFNLGIIAYLKWCFTINPYNASHNCSSLQFDFLYFSKKISLDISCESSVKQTIHMKH